MAKENDEKENEFEPQAEDIIDCGSDNVKFVNLANVALPAITYINILAGVFSYEVTDDFVFIKRAVKLPWDSLENPCLHGKYMFCRYQRGKLDPRLLETLDFNLHNFQGPLKKALEGFLQLKTHGR